MVFSYQSLITHEMEFESLEGKVGTEEERRTPPIKAVMELSSQSRYSVVVRLALLPSFEDLVRAITVHVKPLLSFLFLFFKKNTEPASFFFEPLNHL